MEKKELKEKLIKTAKARGFVCEASSGKVKDLQLTFNQKELLKLISEELDKAREEVQFTKEELKLLRSALGILDGWTVNGKEITELDLKPLYFKLERMFKLKTKEDEK